MDKKRDITGKTYGDLEVLSCVGSRQVGSKLLAFWRVKCACGAYGEFSGAALREGRVTSCGKCKAVGARFDEDLTGQRFGHLTVESRLPSASKRWGAGRVWRCRCDCGQFEDVQASRLKAGAVTRCWVCRM